ncbi:MAG: preprotein translocase subunit SecG [Flavobacteriales bacterium]|nr:preprotein translocase subunit SecG [Flavobacteriales bacterium]
MGGLLTVLVIIGCVGLILFVLVQNPKGGGLNSEFGSAVQLGGAKRATDILEKGTWGLAIGIALICLAMASGGGTADNGEGGEKGIETNTDFEAEDPGGNMINPDNPGLAPAGGTNPGANPNP